MMTSIAIRFGIGDIVTFPDKDQIRLFFQHIDQIFNITDEITDNADAGDVLQKILCIFKSRFFPLADQFFFDALLALDAVLHRMYRIFSRSLVNIVV